jgi:hypothetical protein
MVLLNQRMKLFHGGSDCLIHSLNQCKGSGNIEKDAV